MAVDVKTSSGNLISGINISLEIFLRNKTQNIPCMDLNLSCTAQSYVHWAMQLRFGLGPCPVSEVFSELHRDKCKLKDWM